MGEVRAGGGGRPSRRRLRRGGEHQRPACDLPKVEAVFSDGGFWIIQLLNSLQLAMLLFLLSVGLSVIFGLMNFVNLAHGSLYALGAFIGYSVASELGSFWLALVVAPLAVAATGALLYVTLINRLRAAGPMKQVLVTGLRL